MKTTAIRENLIKWRFWLRLLPVVVLAGVLAFIMLRSVPWSRQDEQAALLQVVSLEQPLESAYRPRLANCREIPVAEVCAPDLEQMLQAAEAAGFSLELETGYLSREELKQRHAESLKQMLAEGVSREEAELRLSVGAYSPGTSEHELGLAVDLKAKDREEESLHWLQEHCWEYGFVLRYEEHKLEWTGWEYQPWHYRYVGREAAGQMQQLDLSLEEYQLWFYSDVAIILSE